MAEDMVRPSHSATAVVQDVEIYVPLEGLVDLDVEKGRLTRDLAKVREDMAQLERKLSRDDFLTRAPEEVIEKERMKYDGLRERESKLAEALEFVQ
jgi:valyl-tRNA synthetase